MIFYSMYNNGAKDLMSIEQRYKYCAGSRRLWSTTLLLWSIKRSWQAAGHLIYLYVFLHTNVCNLELGLLSPVFFKFAANYDKLESIQRRVSDS